MSIEEHYSNIEPAPQQQSAVTVKKRIFDYMTTRLDVTISLSILLTLVILFINAAKSWQNLEDNLAHETENRERSDRAILESVKNSHDNFTALIAEIKEQNKNLRQLIDDHNETELSFLRDLARNSPPVFSSPLTPPRNRH